MKKIHHISNSTFLIHKLYLIDDLNFLINLRLLISDLSLYKKTNQTIKTIREKSLLLVHQKDQKKILLHRKKLGFNNVILGMRAYQQYKKQGDKFTLAT